MKITDKLISIPPYISTSWDKISSIHMSESNLIISLLDETRITIPQLIPGYLQEIFNAHAHFLELQDEEQQVTHNVDSSLSHITEEQMTAPLRVLFGTLESLTQALQHNPAYSSLAPLPEEIANKIEMLGKTLPPEELANFLHPVANCNCMYCQISRILKHEHAPEAFIEGTSTSENSEYEIEDEDLHFEQWEVETVSDKMYHVINKLDPTEHYNVYLGDPIGCTCGKQNCEHIVAVLRH